MKLVRIRQRIEQALSEPRQELGRWAAFFRFQGAMLYYGVRRLHRGNALAISAALSFRTIFALIPLLVLTFLVLKSLGTIEDSKRGLRNFLSASGFTQIAVQQEEQSPSMPGLMPPGPDLRTVNVADKIVEVVDNVENKLTFERLGPVGGALLIWTAMSLFVTVEGALNRIFDAPRSRSFWRRLLLYWTAMTLGPVVVVAASYFGENVVATFKDAPGASWVLVAFGWSGPIVVGILMLAALYTLVPNTSVRFSTAVWGAAIAAPLWVFAKWGFSIYVHRFVVHGNLYGLLGVIPLFLLWLHWSWLIFLLGAQLAHTAGNLASIQRADRVEKMLLGPSDALAVAVAVVRPYLRDQPPPTYEQIADLVRLPLESVHQLVAKLADSRILAPVRGNEDEDTACFIPARPPERVDVAEILRIGDPRANGTGDGHYEPVIAEAVQRVQGRAQSSISGLTLADAAGAPDAAPADPAAGSAPA